MARPWHSVVVRLLFRSIFGVLICCCGAAGVRAEEAEPDAAPEAVGRAGVEDVFNRARPSLAVITVAGRDGRQHGLGTGFVIGADGLIATNMHVIGQGRAISVQIGDGKRYEVTHVHASDRFLDLAILRVDAQGLTPIALGDSDDLRQGQAVVALGNPRGLRHSVVSGVVSGRRDIEGRSMIQLAIPLEPGNSGGPLVDLAGRAVGILTMKSAVTANLGFAVAINELKPLIARPNPVPIDRWVKLGALDLRDWTTLFGANWRSRGRRIIVEGEGDGFGGRALCLATKAPPEVPFEATVTVRLDDEAGAAGLAFAADGGDKHYGFYPSAGALRLTRFDGADVTSWTILAQQPSAFYHQGAWNTLHVRVEAKRIVCSVNGHAVITADVATAPTGRVGLAKFRDTIAEFKGFRVAAEIATPATPAEVVARVDQLIAELPSDARGTARTGAQLAAEGAVSSATLAERADVLARQVEQLRRLSAAVRQAQVTAELAKLLSPADEETDLLAAALCVARLDNDDIDVDSYRRQVERMASEVAAGLAPGADDDARLAALNKFFFEESGFHGNRSDYYHRSNSYANEVLDDREGLPITLSIVYMELARRLGLRVEGVGLPGHFVVRYHPAKGSSRLIDVFDAGQVVGPEEAVELILAATGAPPTDEQQKAMTKRAIVVRVLHNLINVAQRDGDAQGVLRYLDAVLAIAPEEHHDRWTRTVLRWQTGDQEGAKQDADWLLAHEPADIDLARLRDLRAVLERAGN